MNAIGYLKSSARVGVHADVGERADDARQVVFGSRHVMVPRVAEAAPAAESAEIAAPGEPNERHAPVIRNVSAV
jgi:hypothetical protein